MASHQSIPRDADDTLNHVEKRSTIPSKPSNVTPNNQDKSVISENKFSEVAHNYVDGVVDKVMEDYSVLIKHTEEGLEDEDDARSISRNKAPLKDLSIEKRISDDSSVEASPRSNSERSKQDDEQSEAPSDSSAIRNIANDYVSNMIKGLY